ncbi:MAG: sugar ABC transporter ATP-binding protein [Phycisphaerales bacterium]|nr:sugar ABC transporter ATP-binding protein [Phycisphaerales bacterium]
MLRMTGVMKRFGGVVALDGVDIEIRAGEVHALIGENGAGKSTLMKVLSGAHAPDAGSMQLDGSIYAPSGPNDARRRGVAMIYQELTLAPDLTVEQNIMLGREKRMGGRFGLVRASRTRETVRDALARLGRPDITPGTLVGTLSAGERQLVEIARALVENARVVVLDEPTSSIGRQEIARLFEVVRRLRSRNVAVVYISHFLEEIRELGDRFTVLRDGRSVGTGSVSETSNGQLVEMMLGRRVEQLYPNSERSTGEPVLEIKDVAGSPMPQRASITLNAGEILGIGGLVGSGRSELLRSIFGLQKVRSGQVRLATIAGGSLVDITGSSPRANLRSGTGFLSEDRKNEGLALRLPIAINATLTRLAEPTGAGRFGLVRRSALARHADALRRSLGIQSSGPWQTTSELSGGNQQKVALARLMHHDCDVLLLDEPTRGVDVGSKAQIYRLLDELASRGTAIIAVCSYVPELLGISDRVAVMHRGVLGTPRRAEDWTEREILEEALVGGSTEAVA